MNKLTRLVLGWGNVLVGGILIVTGDPGRAVLGGICVIIGLFTLPGCTLPPKPPELMVIKAGGVNVSPIQATLVHIVGDVVYLY